MLNIIDKIQNDIFCYNINSMSSSIPNLIEKIASFMKNLDDVGIKKINEILEFINLGLQNKDYLFVTDILEFELKPLYIKNLKNTGDLTNEILQ